MNMEREKWVRIKEVPTAYLYLRAGPGGSGWTIGVSYVIYTLLRVVATPGSIV